MTWVGWKSELAPFLPDENIESLPDFICREAGDHPLIHLAVERMDWHKKYPCPHDFYKNEPNAGFNPGWKVESQGYRSGSLLRKAASRREWFLIKGPDFQKEVCGYPTEKYLMELGAYYKHPWVWKIFPYLSEGGIEVVQFMNWKLAEEEGGYSPYPVHASGSPMESYLFKLKKVSRPEGE